MKNISTKALVFSLITLSVALSILAFSISPEEIRYTWQGYNPWVGIQGIFSALEYRLKLRPFYTWALTAAILLFFIWRLYKAYKPRKKRNYET